jgi:hypothetical protein
MTDSELTRIILTVPSISDRANLLSHVSRLKSGGGVESQTSSRICDWIERTWPENTVRAKMARKVSGMIRAGDWKDQ